MKAKLQITFFVMLTAILLTGTICFAQEQIAPRPGEQITAGTVISVDEKAMTFQVRDTEGTETTFSIVKGTQFTLNKGKNLIIEEQLPSETLNAMDAVRVHSVMEGKTQVAKQVEIYR